MNQGTTWTVRVWLSMLASAEIQSVSRRTANKGHTVQGVVCPAWLRHDGQSAAFPLLMPASLPVTRENT